MPNYRAIKHFLLGPPRDLFNKDTKHSIALVAFMAWIGLGADGLSSSCYGPQEAFLALGTHTQLGIYLAIATVATVFIISMAYMQVIDLFPNGGGGYKVATTLIGPRAGLVSGSALIIDYVLTIAISIAAGTDALFSLFSPSAQGYKLLVDALLILFLIYLNLRGAKESIKVLMPIFIGFVVTHAFLIIYGIIDHSSGLPDIVPDAVTETFELADMMGWVFVMSLMLKAISLGGGTYTGLEAVSNNVGTLVEPKAHTGKLTMVYVAISLAFMAAGIILLYLLWDAEYTPGQTLNAVVFRSIMADWHIGDFELGPVLLPAVMLFETGLLFVAANTGFLAGPPVLARMATDKWMPHFFSSLSSRLVTKHGIVLIGLSALAVLLLTGGKVSVLVVLYSINVFITFTLSMFGLCRHWLRVRRTTPLWWVKLTIAGIGLLVTSNILIITTVEKYSEGGWLTLLITGAVVALGWSIHKNYQITYDKLDLANELFSDDEMKKAPEEAPKLDHSKPTAVFVVNENVGSAMHTLLWVLRMFPGVYHNFVFIGVGEVVSESFHEEESWKTLRRSVKQHLRYYTNYCQNQWLAATYYVAFGTDVVDKVGELTERVTHDYPKAMFFTSKLIFENENVFTRMLYNETAYIIQRRLHNRGYNMIIVPMNI